MMSLSAMYLTKKKYDVKQSLTGLHDKIALITMFE